MDGWMASLTWWTWVWVISGSWWWMGKPDVLQSMGLQRGGHDWATALKWLRLGWLCFVIRIIKLHAVFGVSENWLRDLSSFIQSLFKSYPFVLNSRHLSWFLVSNAHVIYQYLLKSWTDLLSVLMVAVRMAFLIKYLGRCFNITILS